MRSLRRAFLAGMAVILACAMLPSAAPADERAAADGATTLSYFFSPSCHRCEATRRNVMPLVADHFGATLRIEYRDISEADNYRMLFTLKKNAAADEKSVFPVLCIGTHFIDGRDEENLTYSSIAAFVERSRAEMSSAPKGLSPKAATNADIMTYFKNLGPVAIMAAGFVDGINPCAFTVIVFFMSFLFFHGYRRRRIALVGIAFIAAVFTTYFLLGVGLFGGLRAMKGFWFVAAMINLAIGIFSITLGIVSIYDAFKYRRTGEGEDMILRLPKGIKTKIQSIIGEQYRAKEMRQTHISPVVLIGSALAVGFTISLFESVCTGQLYLPTIVFVFKTSPYKMAALGHLFLYNLMFIIPLVAIYFLALAGVTSQVFATVMKKHLFLIKLFMAAMFIFLGVSLVYADAGTETAPVRASTPAAGPQQPQRMDLNSFDFGTVTEGDVLKHTFILENASGEPFTVTQVNTSCACATSDLKVRRLEPGQKVPVELAFDTKGYPGPRKRQLFIHTDAPDNPLIIFEVSAEVLRK